MEYLQNIKLYIALLGIGLLVVGGVVWNHSSKMEDAGVFKAAAVTESSRAEAAKSKEAKAAELAEITAKTAKLNYENALRDAEKAKAQVQPAAPTASPTK